MPDCHDCGEPMARVNLLSEPEPRFACANPDCPSAPRSATLDDVLAELRRLRADMARLRLVDGAGAVTPQAAVWVALLPDLVRALNESARAAPRDEPAAEQGSRRRDDGVSAAQCAARLAWLNAVVEAHLAPLRGRPTHREDSRLSRLLASACAVLRWRPSWLRRAGRPVGDSPHPSVEEAPSAVPAGGRCADAALGVP